MDKVHTLVAQAERTGFDPKILCASSRGTGVVETGGSGGSLASLSSQIGQLWVQRIRWSARDKAQWVRVPASKISNLS